MKRRTTVLGLAAGLTVALAVPTAALAGPAADTTVVVRGDTLELTADGPRGWQFNPGTVSDYEFTTEEEASASGSLFVPALQAAMSYPDAAPGGSVEGKFVAANVVGQAITDDLEISFAYLLADATPARDVYLNVYVNAEDDGKFFDCRYDFLATSDEAGWQSVSSTDEPVDVARSSTARLAACASALTDMDGSYVRAFALNVGHSTDSDVGSSAYLDAVRMTADGTTTTWDFEATPTTRTDCTKGGWAEYGVANQGRCIALLQADEHARR